MVPVYTALDNNDDTDSTNNIAYSEEDHFSSINNEQTSDSDSGEYHFTSSQGIPETPCIDDNNMALTQDIWETSSPKALPAIPVMGINKSGVNTSVITPDSAINQTQSLSPLLHPPTTLCVNSINNDVAKGANNTSKIDNKSVTSINSKLPMPTNNEMGKNKTEIQSLKLLCH